MEYEMLSYIQRTFNSNSYNGHSGIPTDITTPLGSANAIPNRPMASFQSPLSQSLNLPAFNSNSGIPTDITTPPGSANAIPNRPMASFQSPLSQSLNFPNNQWDGINK